MVNTYKNKPSKQETIDKKIAGMATGSTKASTSQDFEEVPSSRIELAKRLGLTHLYSKSK